MENENLSFGQAVEAMEKGEMVARSGWNGKGMFTFMRPGDVLESDFIPKVKSLPDKVKGFLHNTGRAVVFLPYLCMYTATGEIVNGWLASQTDMLAKDWTVVTVE